ncbi:hypothetical protein GCM10010218_15720 [Streptomyces mashuensis]|uniref:SMI1/KNR4 family protein n=1 Tax=Streptomyces mashuensis TaxID=33904 RepID=A0A919EBS7_9ACTN|nr:hypothetical protein [Streptomyces mashuensis]GHF35346.1 hypothetical protein GCM10010218_15720 [Streptomyces mashuensis]
MIQLLVAAELPEGFTYPPQFIRVVELGLTNLEPWWILDGEQLRGRVRGLRERYPKRKLVPFARREDNDDVACWDLEHGDVVIIHDFASAGWEQSRRFAHFNDWLRRAVEDLIEFGDMEERVQ